MLTDEEKQEVAKAAEESLHWKDACVEAVLLVQKHRGWVSDEVLVDVAQALNMTPSELESVVTFYPRIYRKPVGRHVILLCDSPSCWLTGSEGLLAHFRKRLGINFGETTTDGSFTLLSTDCLGGCDHAPGMMVDEQFYGDLNPARIDEVLESVDGSKR